MKKTSKLYESLLREADKTRFIKPIYDEVSLDPQTAFAEMGLDASLANEYFPDLKALASFADGPVAAKAEINWQKMGTNTTEFYKLLKAFVEWKSSGGSRKERKTKRTTFSDKEKFHILPFENKNWLFVAPRNYEACKYMNSAECGGRGAKWCIGYERSPDYWEDHVSRRGEAFVLAIKKNGVPDKINSLDYDNFYSDFHEDTIARKYMIEIENSEMSQSFVAQAWRPCDDPNETIRGVDKLSRLFGPDIEQVIDYAFKNKREIINDVKLPPTFEELISGVETDLRDLEYSGLDIDADFNTSILFEKYGNIQRTITFTGCNFNDVTFEDSGGVGGNLQVFFESCTIKNAYFTPLTPKSGYTKISIDRHSAIDHVEYSGIDEMVGQLRSNSSDDNDDEDYGYRYDGGDLENEAFESLYGNGAYEVSDLCLP